MKTPTDMLRDEHVLIVHALTMLEDAADPDETSRPMPAQWWDELIGWLRAFADRNHHAKEEQSLFPAMIKAGLPSEGGPIAVMLEEHAQGRALIQVMAQAEPARRAVVARQYVALLRQHIEKENGVLFPLADSLLDEQAVQAVRRDFDSVEIELGPSASIVEADATLARLRAVVGGADP